LLGFQGYEICPTALVPDNKNPFSVRTDNNSWGCCFGELKKREDVSLYENNRHLEFIMQNLFKDYIELDQSCGTNIFTFGSLRYPLISILAGYAINVKDRAIYKKMTVENDNSYIKVGNVSEQHIAILKSTANNKDLFLINAVDMILSFGLPFCLSEKQQCELEDCLSTAAKDGFSSASLALSAFLERKKDQVGAYTLMEQHKADPYCLYNCACIDIQQHGELEEGINKMWAASTIGFLAADSALLQLYNTNNNARQYIDDLSIPISNLHEAAISKNDPDTLKHAARQHAQNAELVKAEQGLYLAARQGDIEAIRMLLDLYGEFKINKKLTKNMKGRKKFIESQLDGLEKTKRQ
jgi:hypothetical protein